MSRLACVPDYQDYAKLTMAKPFYDYLQGYSEDGHTYSQNNKDFESIKLKLRGMLNMKHFQGTETTILGHKVSSPIHIAPIPYQSLYHVEGELPTA